MTELALAVDRPKSTVAYHVNQLVDAGLLKVVRTQRVRAIEERYYGRVARTIYIGALTSDEDIALVANVDGIATAYGESRRAKEADDLRCTLVHARIPIEEVRAFWAEVQEVARKFAQIPRSGDQVYGFVAGLYPSDAPALPETTPTPRRSREPPTRSIRAEASHRGRDSALRSSEARMVISTLISSPTVMPAGLRTASLSGSR